MNIYILKNLVFIQCLYNPSKYKTHGFPFPTALLTFPHGNNMGSLSFVWRVPVADDITFTESHKVIRAVHSSISQPNHVSRAV